MNERKNEWRTIIEQFFKNNTQVEIYFKYPQFDKPTRRSGKIESVGFDNFGLIDVRIGLSYFAYDYVISVQPLQEDRI